MSLLSKTLDALNDQGLSCAMIGATAMAAHGVSRATLDLDLLLVGRDSLDSPAWQSLREAGIDVDVRRGSPDDPLVGVIRLQSPGEAPIDIVVGSFAWQRRAIERANVVTLKGTAVRVATSRDLILLKLYAGSPQDRWDISRLLTASPDARLPREVESDLSELPKECREIWRSIVDPASR